MEQSQDAIGQFTLNHSPEQFEVIELKGRATFVVPEKDQPIFLTLGEAQLIIQKDDEAIEPVFALSEIEKINDLSSPAKPLIISNKPLILGRTHQHGLTQLQHLSVARNHTSLTARIHNGQLGIIIEDLNSPAGTKVYLLKKPTQVLTTSQTLTPQKTSVLNFKTGQTLEQFLDFTKQNTPKLQTLIQDRDDVTLLETIYRYFYGGGHQPVTISPKLQAFYTSELNHLQRELQPLLASDSQLLANEHWLYYGRNLAGLNNCELGRLYLNLQPQILPYFTKRLVFRLLNTPQYLSLIAKIPRQADNVSMGRAGKMIIYFNNQDEQKIIDFVNDIYSLYQDYFINHTPAFTTDLFDNHQQPLKGVSFDEDPAGGKASFGTTRSYLLMNLLKKDLPQDKLSSMEETTTAFIQQCPLQQIDPKNPAFNLHSHNFQTIRQQDQTANF